MYNFKVYAKGENTAMLHKEYSFEATDAVSLSEVKELSKKKGEYWVSPMNEDSAAALFQRARRKSNWTAEMAKFAHECALKGFSNLKTQMEIYVKFKTVVTVDSVAKTLRQESNLDLDVDANLREKVAATLPEKGKRGGGTKKVTPEVEAKIHEGFDAGKTGTKIGEELGLSSSTVNSVRRKTHGYRAKHKVGQPTKETTAAPEAAEATV